MLLYYLLIINRDLLGFNIPLLPMLLVLVTNSGIPRETLAEESFPKVFWASMIRGLDFCCPPSLGNFYVDISES